MPRKIALLYGHPDTDKNRLCCALSDAYQLSAGQAGHVVRRIDVADLVFPSIKNSADFEQRSAPADILSAQEIIKWADHLVLVFPLWVGSMPGLLKMFLEQVFRPGFAMDYSTGKFPGKLLTGKSARVIVTMGMPTLAYRLYYFSHGMRNLKRNMLNFCGISPVQFTLIGQVGDVSENTQKKWFNTVRKLGWLGK